MEDPKKSQEKKKGFLARMFDKIDEKMKEKSTCCCCNTKKNIKKDDKSCCS